MNKNYLLGIAATLFGLTASLSTPAEATVIVQNFNLSSSPNNGTQINTTTNRRSRAWVLNSQIAQFNIAVGDTLEVNLTFDAPLSMQDFGDPSLEYAQVSFSNMNISPNFGFSFENSGARYLGVTGSFDGDPDLASGTRLGNSFTGPPPSGQRLESIPLLSAGNITSDVMFFTGISFFWNITAIDPQTAPFTFASFVLLDDSNPVPAPGALALLGLGLFGIGGLRRKKPRKQICQSPT
jgi:hypothetical protein